MAEVNGKRMYLDLSDRGLSWPLFLRGVYEDFETRVFKEVVKRGNVVVDVGAGIGYYSLLAAHLVGEEGMVYAFEPEPNNYGLLVKNVEINEISNVVCIRKAMSNKTGHAKLFLSATNRGDHRIYDLKDGRESVSIEVTSLDTFFEGQPRRIDVIKMDVQGAEAQVLEGMSSLIQENPDLVILTEFWPLGLQLSGSSAAEFLNQLLRHHFVIYDMNEVLGQLDPVDPSELVNMRLREKHTNLLCVKGRAALSAALIKAAQKGKN
jgi:FkbM family methyltransferase